MGVIWTPYKRTTQPKHSARVDWSNPLARDLQALYDLRTGIDVVSGTKASADTATRYISHGIEGRDYSGTANTQFPHSARTAITGSLSIAAFLSLDAATNYLPVITKQNGPVSHNAYEFRLSYGATSTDLSVVRSNGTDYSIWQGSGGNVVSANGQPQLVGFSTGPLLNSTGVFWANRQKYSSSLTGSGSSAAPSDLSTTTWIGRRADGATQLDGKIHYIALFNRQLSDAEWVSLFDRPWQLFAAETRTLIFDLGSGGSTVTGVGSSAGVGTVSGVGASTSAQAGSSAGVGAASGVGASTANSVGSSTGTGTASGVGSSTGGSDGVGASTGTGTASGIGASTAASTGSSEGVGAGSGVGASTAASVGSASGTGEALGVGANGSVVSTGVGSASGTGTATGISPSVSQGGGKTTGKNLSRKQKKKLKAVESQEWLKAEETARQLLSDRFTKQTPQEKAQALETYIESLQPVIEALKALTSQIEEVVEEAPVIELTPHQEVIQRFDRLEKKVKSVEELIIILMADL